MTTDGIAGAVALLRAGVDGLLDADLDALTSPDVLRLIESLEVQRRRLEAVDARVLALAGERGTAGEYARSSTAELLVHTLRVAPGEAQARVRRAGDLGPRRSLTGEPLGPIHPVLAAAQRAGSISGAQVDVVTHMLGRIPGDISIEATPVAEACLTDAALHENPRQLAVTAAMLLERLDQDGTEPDDEKAYRRRDFSLRHNGDGTWTPGGSLTEETGLVWSTIINALSAPIAATEGERDTRTAGQRRHDGLLEAGSRLLRSGSLPDTGGTPVTVLIRTTAADLESPRGLAQTEDGEPIRTRTLISLLGDAALIPLVFDRSQSDCQLLLGRTRRLASPAQRRALAARDGGCAFPGCLRPSSWTEVHHIEEWTPTSPEQPGGRTDIDNLCLLCAFHHREFERRGWSVIMTDGLPHWIPPAFIDPERTPRRNCVHQLPDISFTPEGTLMVARA